MKCFSNGNNVLKNDAKVRIILRTSKQFGIFFVILLAYSYLCTQNCKVMEIKKAEFTLSAPRESMCPKDTKPEYAFIGRSNVGKSSLINMLTNNKKLAKTSATPGKTLLINHFIINNEWYLVDLPGYGFAKRSKKEVQRLEQMINGYILQREQLVNVFLLVDVRLEPQKVDLDFIQWLGASSVPFAIVFTKADKLSANVGRTASYLWHLVREKAMPRGFAQLY